MLKHFFQFLLVATLAFAAPVAQASIADTRDEVVAALDVVISDLEAVIADKEAQIAPPNSLTPAEVAEIENEILVLEGRVRFVQVTQAQVPFYNATLLNRTIARFMLPVSPA